MTIQSGKFQGFALVCRLAWRGCWWWWCDDDVLFNVSKFAGTKKDLQNKKIRAMNIPSARLQLQQASPANIKSRSQYESTRPVQKPRNRFPALKQALMAHIKENPTKLIGYSLKECEAFQEKYP